VYHSFKSRLTAVQQSFNRGITNV